MVGLRSIPISVCLGFGVFKPISDADVIVNKNMLSVLLNKLYIGR